MWIIFYFSAVLAVLSALVVIGTGTTDLRQVLAGFLVLVLSACGLELVARAFALAAIQFLFLGGGAVVGLVRMTLGTQVTGFVAWPTEAWWRSKFGLSGLAIAVVAVIGLAIVFTNHPVWSVNSNNSAGNVLYGLRHRYPLATVAAVLLLATGFWASWIIGRIDQDDLLYGQREADRLERQKRHKRRRTQE